MNVVFVVAQVNQLATAIVTEMYLIVGVFAAEKVNQMNVVDVMVKENQKEHVIAMDMLKIVTVTAVDMLEKMSAEYAVDQVL